MTTIPKTLMALLIIPKGLKIKIRPKTMGIMLARIPVRIKPKAQSNGKPLKPIKIRIIPKTTGKKPRII